MTQPRAFSIRQPWAWAICYGYKPVENRDWESWNPGLTYRGPVLIHAGKREEKDDVAIVVGRVGDLEDDHRRMEDHYHEHGHLGAIVGTATIVDCVTEHPSPWFSGPYGFVIEDARPIRPIPYKGMLGFFRVPDEIHEQIARQEQGEDR